MDGLVESAEARDLPSIGELRAGIEPHVRQMEKLRRLPDEVVERLKECGVFRMFVPKRFGGEERDFLDALELITRIATIDASAGWVASITSGGCLLLPRLPAASLHYVYRDGPNQVIAGSAQPRGVGTRIAGGWRVSGRWPLASGCSAADWMLLAFKESPDDAMKVMLVPANQVVVEDTWHAMGLKGSGSHHVTAHEVVVSDEFVLSLETESLSVDSALYRLPRHLIAPMHGAVQIGIAQAALWDITEIQNENCQAAPGRRELAQFTLGACSVRLDAARVALRTQVQANWSAAIAGRDRDVNGLTATVQLGAHIASETLDIVRRCFELAGSTSVYESCPLERRLRDIQVATQHGMVQRANFIAGGKHVLEKAPSDNRTSVLFG